MSAAKNSAGSKRQARMNCWMIGWSPLQQLIYHLANPYDFFDRLFFGTLAPFFRASESPIAIACFLLLTFLPDPPLLSVPAFRFFMARPTFFAAPLEYLRFFAIASILSLLCSKYHVELAVEAKVHLQ